MVVYTPENGNKESVMAKENKYGMMKLIMKDIG